MVLPLDVCSLDYTRTNLLQGTHTNSAVFPDTSVFDFASWTFCKVSSARGAHPAACLSACWAALTHQFLASDWMSHFFLMFWLSLSSHSFPISWGGVAAWWGLCLPVLLSPDEVKCEQQFTFCQNQRGGFMTFWQKGKNVKWFSFCCSWSQVERPEGTVYHSSEQLAQTEEYLPPSLSF